MAHRFACIQLAGIEIRALEEGEEELGVPATHILGVRRILEALERVLADRVEHAEPAAAPLPHEILDDERLEHVEVGIADGLRGV